MCRGCRHYEVPCRAREEQDADTRMANVAPAGGLKGVCRGCRHYEVPCRAREEQDADTRMANVAPAGGGGGAGNEPPLQMGQWLVAPGGGKY